MKNSMGMDVSFPSLGILQLASGLMELIYIRVVFECLDKAIHLIPQSILMATY